MPYLSPPTLTADEQRFHQLCKLVGAQVNIIETVDDALQMIGASC